MAKDFFFLVARRRKKELACKEKISHSLMLQQNGPAPCLYRSNFFASRFEWMSAPRIEIADIANCELARFQHCTYLSRRFRVERWWNREEDDDLGKNPKTREDSLRCCAPLRSPFFLPTPPPGAHAHGQKNNARIKKNVRISSSSSAHSLPPATSNWKFLHSPANCFWVSDPILLTPIAGAGIRNLDPV